MKKYILFLVVIVLVLSAVGIARTNPVWASILPTSLQSAAQPATGVNSSGLYAPPAVMMTITGNGKYNLGGVCTLEVAFKAAELKVIADAEVPIIESQKVPFSSSEELFYPGCHFVLFKQNAIISPLSTDDGSAKVCFGANQSPHMVETIYYYLDNPGGGSRVWIPLPSTLEDNGRLVCAPAIYTGVYMPAGKFVLPSGSEIPPGTNPLFPYGWGGSVLPPPSNVTITGSGTYAVGGICLLIANYKIAGLFDTVQVKYLTEDTLKVPSPDVAGLFYFPGCQVEHYRDQKIKDQMTRAEGDWQICFAATPDKTMKIYYYKDNLTTITPPWTGLETSTSNGMACANLVDFSGVYVPTGK